ncbi:MAG: lytic transglycosylase domain-containing protein [Spirochaetales bacterium]|nr:lytic transglycosylase domain-containing protein [Spirochaetales bacterium]
MINRILVLLTAAAILGCSTTLPTALSGASGEEAQFAFSWDSEPVRAVVPEDYTNVLNLLDGDKPMLALYREDLTHQAVTEFFLELTGSPAITMPILYHAERADMPLSLVFSIAWVESRYSPVAVNVNRNATSVDRGLFQLNSRTFTDLTEEDFFNPDVNTYHGIEYLSWCMEHTETDIQALTCYNAGLSRVRSGYTPPTTVVYIDRATRFRASLERRFRSYMLSRFPTDMT